MEEKIQTQNTLRRKTITHNNTKETLNTKYYGKAWLTYLNTLFKRKNSFSKPAFTTWTRRYKLEIYDFSDVAQKDIKHTKSNSSFKILETLRNASLGQYSQILPGSMNMSAKTISCCFALYEKMHIKLDLETIKSNQVRRKLDWIISTPSPYVCHIQERTNSWTMDSMCVQLWKNHCTFIFYLFHYHMISWKKLHQYFWKKICPDDSHPKYSLDYFFYLLPYPDNFRIY